MMLKRTNTVHQKKIISTITLTKGTDRQMDLYQVWIYDVYEEGHI